MPIRTVLALVALLLARALHAQPASAPGRLFQGEDLFRLEVATDPQVSPDGRSVVYVRRSNDIMTDRARSTLWHIDVRSGEQAPLVAGPGSHMQPRWSPDGSRIAYISTAGEDSGAQLHVRWMETGASVRLTGLPATPRGIVWSPDGKRIAYTMFVPDAPVQLGKAPARPQGAKWAEPLQVIDSVVYRVDGGGYLKPGFEQLFWLPADGGAPVQLTFGAHHVRGGIAWAPDGRSILFGANLDDDWQREMLESELHEVSIDTREVRTLTRRKGPDNAPAVSPDGRWIAWVGFDDRELGYQNRRLNVMRRDGGQARVLGASLDSSVGDIAWTADSRAVLALYDQRGETFVGRFGLDGSLRVVAQGLTGDSLDRPYTGGEYSAARDGTIAFTRGSAQRPADVWITRGGDARRLTQLNESLLGTKRLGEVRPLAVTAADGLAIDAWLVTPPDFDPARRHPLILEIHGGPYAAYAPAFATDYQLYAAAGYVVLYANPRGSTSYGEAFANRIEKAYPGEDYGDLMAAVDAAIATGFVDADNLFVTGGSGGGVLTAWIVGKTDRFRAAATQKPVIDWASFVLTADMSPLFARYWFGAFPWQDPQAYWNRSPLSLVGNVRTPTLVVVGSEDYRTPVSESEQYYTALQLRGIPTALVKVPGASHGGIAERPSQSAAKASAILAWFERYRAGAPR